MLTGKIALFPNGFNTTGQNFTLPDFNATKSALNQVFQQINTGWYMTSLTHCEADNIC